MQKKPKICTIAPTPYHTIQSIHTDGSARTDTDSYLHQRTDTDGFMGISRCTRHDTH
jgi:hypothetical protein